MEKYSDHAEPEICQPRVFSAGLQHAQKIIQKLIHMIVWTEKEMVEAGVHLGEDGDLLSASMGENPGLPSSWNTNQHNPYLD